MKKIIVPIINIAALIVILFAVIPVYYIFLTIWYFKIPKEQIKNVVHDIFVDWKENLKDIFSDKFLFED